MKKVVVFSQIDQDVLARLQQSYQVVVLNPKLGDINEQIRTEVVDADAMIGAGRLLNESNLAPAQKLKIISTVSVGYDNYDVEYLNQRKIWLANTPHVLTETTADLAFSLLLSAARKIPQLDSWTKQGQWKRTVPTDQFGVDVFGKTLGIIGLGHIGAAIARRGFYGFNMNILYHNRREKIEVAQAVNAQYRELDQLLQQSDFVVVAVDLNNESKALMGEAQFDLMQKHAVFVNIARGSVVDEDALIQALQQNKIFAAGLDVYAKEPLQDSPLFELANVVTAPHIGSATLETRQKMVNLAYQNLIDALEDRVPRYLVNPKFE
ncbi:D-glycerate dehydrogenase [Acinetobacter haemolyticus]|uniref:Bifunctional glyoxylate/hydroxypyruvate reductase B n=1 Tax=Acinetobacter haemolyticus TaxID=29430 RepID=A0A1L6KLC3_ACIHA|nr:D-glycerate dehydrogenase [Acinetobacter haemolyticus]APR69870.1 bifunctional glyoxylate/hydroxypyruvate reductase B [Acinetobacter haemolyticus]MQZ30222.1 D-glycerate dehydrogenase [Acinetobacter haemolyticus]NAR18364.1 bifunctional glyoxylate/hydroxypyruvate reductase B [Acinetobacter haemolyticus]NAR30740.1 bifunctional glyoxylate/hydroxypyruvate reductase B [Acinetobacter haemolyticus]NAR37541.1 bifunctional glyoxylate/hydroxypyruvate reductase B [Acinetobacter haemolyticus]